MITRMKNSTVHRLHISGLIILFTIHYSLFTAFAQDRPPATPPPLPFQQQAQETNDEQLGSFRAAIMRKLLRYLPGFLKRNHPITFILII
jgi:hypothetical protein